MQSLRVKLLQGALLLSAPFVFLAIPIVKLFNWRKNPYVIVSRVWLDYLKLMMRCITSVKVEFTGQENLPPAPFIIAAKHQSTAETFFLFRYFDRPAFIFRKGLLKIPIFGKFIGSFDMICIDRAEGFKAIRSIAEQAKQRLDKGRVVVIFPEGTRVEVGKHKKFQSGIYAIHKIAPSLPIVPVAVNAGVCWPKDKFIQKPGTITIKFLPPLQGDFEKQELTDRLYKIITSETDKLCLQSSAE
jgi:1-acyl-sn-glycerol-3-phosphate acyltransferase